MMFRIFLSINYVFAKRLNDLTRDFLVVISIFNTNNFYRDIPVPVWGPGRLVIAQAWMSLLSIKRIESKSGSTLLLKGVIPLGRHLSTNILYSTLSLPAENTGLLCNTHQRTAAVMRR